MGLAALTFSSSGSDSCSALWWYLQYSITLMRILESTMGRGTGVSRPVSSTMFLTVTERHATSFSTSKISSCFDFSLTDVDSATRTRRRKARTCKCTCHLSAALSRRQADEGQISEARARADERSARREGARAAKDPGTMARADNHQGASERKHGRDDCTAWGKAEPPQERRVLVSRAQAGRILQPSARNENARAHARASASGMPVRAMPAQVREFSYQHHQPCLLY